MSDERSLVVQRQRQLKWPALDWLEAVLMMLCGVTLAGFCTSVIFDIVTRELRMPWLWLQEVTSTFFIYGIFIGAAVATRRNDHLFLAAVGEFFTGRPRLLIESAIRLVVIAVGLFLAWKLYWNAKEDVFATKFSGLSKLMSNRFYFDEIYEATVIRLHDTIATISDFIDRWIVEGLCLGFVRSGTDLTGRALRLVQTGNLQTYAFLFVLGVAVVLWFVLGK